MRRFFVENIDAKQASFSITGSEAKHIFRVLRMGPGDRFVLMDGKGARFLALIESAGPQEVRVFLEKPLPEPSPSPVEITLCQGLLKSRKMDYLIQKTSELGVDCIIPFSSERTVVRLKKDRLPGRMKHWREIAQSSAKQSDRAVPAQIEGLVPFNELVAKWKEEDALKIVLWEEEGSKDLKGLLRKSSIQKKVIGMVGPEGGFSRQEIEAAKDAGFVAASLGYRILRSETAAITTVAVVQYELGDLSLFGRG
ncbi:MAG: 16S rRNA (uracil(1498)-N(3))-methyltransferase [Deltaproteobacteria bacterium]|nr:16S rRNA (uracil(1498)-N(3))-methyltransferase [Deltaproteobacteria bacterium]